ncbi:MAG: hypothetical protein K2X27_03540 [Candidatus Obscuribacterales bacterium]|nr:hypothetical protein [Candidatus Obscuribacterales bacterium]
MTKNTKNLALTLLLLLQLFFPQLCFSQDTEQSYAEPDANDLSRIIEKNGERIDFGKLFVFSAGIHKFEEDHLHPGKAVVVRQDMKLIEAFSNRAVPEDHIVALKDESATRANCIFQLRELLRKTKPGDFLLLFMHSHGSSNRGGLICTYDIGGVWTFDELISEIENNFQGERACLCVAACHSGSLINVIKSSPRRVAYFALTSVHPDLNALTVATSDFEACIRDAFSGAPCPDINNDGVITFAEFGRYVSNDQSLLFGTEPDFGWTDAFNANQIISDAAPKSGRFDCRLVKLQNGVRGRIIKQEGDRVLIRGSKNPSAIEWVNISRTTAIRARKQ